MQKVGQKHRASEFQAEKKNNSLKDFISNGNLLKEFINKGPPVGGSAERNPYCLSGKEGENIMTFERSRSICGYYTSV